MKEKQVKRLHIGNLIAVVLMLTFLASFIIPYSAGVQIQAFWRLCAELCSVLVLVTAGAGGAYALITGLQLRRNRQL